MSSEASVEALEEIRDRDQGVPWKAMAGMRDRLIHAYDNINVDIVWNTACTGPQEGTRRHRSNRVRGNQPIVK